PEAAADAPDDVEREQDAPRHRDGHHPEDRWLAYHRPEELSGEPGPWRLEGGHLERTGGRMAEIVAAALTSHAPLITGKPDIEKPEQRDRFYAGYREIHRRLVATRPDLIMMFVNDHLQNFPYSNMPAFCVGLADAYDAPSPGGARLMRLPPRKVPGATEWSMALLESGLEAGF